MAKMVHFKLYTLLLLIFFGIRDRTHDLVPNRRYDAELNPWPCYVHYNIIKGNKWKRCIKIQLFHTKLLLADFF